MLGESWLPPGALRMLFSLFGKSSGPTLCPSPWALLKDRLGTVRSTGEVKWNKQIAPSFYSEPLVVTFSLLHSFLEDI